MKEIGRFDQGRDVCIYLHGQALAQSLAGEPAEFFRAIAMVRLWPSFMGIGGAVVGGLLTRSVGFGYGGTIITTLVAMISAALVTKIGRASCRERWEDSGVDCTLKKR